MTHAIIHIETELVISRDWSGEIGFDAIWALRRFGPRTDLMAGVDETNPEVQKLIANIMDFVGSDAEVALDDVRRERVG